MCCGLNRYYRPAKGFLLLAVIVLMSLTSALPALAEEETPGQNELEFFLQFNLWAPDIKIETTFDKKKVNTNYIEQMYNPGKC